jgi:peptidoglycan/xylan/chitin deacetylase (PgdA/CDA1 family)
MKLKIKKSILFFAIITSVFSCIFNFKALAVDEVEETKKVVYITFDDGPSGKLTNEILDILKEYNAKATFFVIGNMIKGQEKILCRMLEEGHSIGLHTYSHERDKIYRSSKSFIDEMLLTQQLLEEATGKKSTIIRFPFGCNNNAYKLTSSMVTALHNNNFKIYDWTVDSTDGMNPNLAPYKIAQRAKTDKDTAVVLLHCGYLNKNTAKALPSILKYYKDNNYEFRVIDENTPEVFRLKKNK